MKNLKVSTRLIAGFLFVAALALIVGAVGIFGMYQISEADKALYETNLIAIQAMGNINNTLAKIRIHLRTVAIWYTHEDTYQSALKDMDKLIKSMDTYMDQYQATIALEDKEDQENFDQLKAVYDSIVNEVIPKVLAPAAIDDNDQVKVELENAADLVHQFDQQAEKSVLYNSELAREAAAHNTALFKTMTIVAAIVLVISVAIAIVLGIYMSRSVSRPLVAIAGIADKVAEGNTDVDCSAYFGKSETGMLAQSFHEMVNAIKALVEDTDMLVDSSRAGQLDKRADVSKHMGDYRRIVEGINDMLDGVVTPINEASMVLSEMAQGNLGASVKGEYQGDHARIKNALNDTIKQLNGYIGDLKYALASMAKGNFDVEITSEFRGDFISLKDSTNDIADSMSEILRGINTASDQVAAGTKQVSDGAQAVSQGATEQASAIEELTATITEISEQVKKTAVNAGEVNRAAEQTKEKATEGNEQMRQMQEAMEAINASSANISKIIKVIDDIAFQTNILALNAAVEAARAGVHGKGFAVVAEEVRNLAAKSASAAKETTDLIESSIGKTKAGTQIANDTAQSLQEIEEMVEGAVNAVGLIATASNEEALGISQVNKGIEQMSQVVQANSATSEQTAAAAEELTSQADMLKSMISRFTLRSESHRARGPKAIPAPAAPNRPSALQGGMQDRQRHTAQRPLTMREEPFARPSMPGAEFRQEKPMGLEGFERFPRERDGVQDILDMTGIPDLPDMPDMPDMTDEPDFFDGAEKYSNMDASQMSDHDFGKY